MATRSGAGGDVLAGPATKENSGCSHCSGHGLIAYGAGNSIVVVDVRSMQLLCVLPMPSAPTSSWLSPAPYVTALQWAPGGMLLRSAMDDLSATQLQLAAGDRHGRISIWDVGSGVVTCWLMETENTNASASTTNNSSSKLGIQRLCWIKSRPSLLLAAIHGTNLLIIWDPRTKSPVWRYEANADVFTSLACDYLRDARQLCVVGVKGLLLSVLVAGTTENDILVKSFQLLADDQQRGGGLKGEAGGGTSGNGMSSGVVQSMPCCAFSSGAAAILYVVYSREVVVFDLQFGMRLSSMPVPRGCGKILDFVTDVGGELLFLAHADGKLSTWKRKEHSQAFSIVQMDSLMPSIGSPVPPPSVLAVSFCPTGMPAGIAQLLESKHKDELWNQLTLISISDDGRLWEWTIKYESGATADDATSGGDGDGQARSPFQLELTGQLHILPSSVTTLAVSVPSMLATVSGGGNAAAASVPLIALATQAGTVELLDPFSLAVTSSFAVHNNSVVRGIRWLGNSRLVSFSYTEVKGKGAGFINRLVLTCVRSGQSRCFRVLQKPERAPMRALRTSPSGRYMLILFREAPAEVWVMTKNPQMLRSLALPFTVMEWALPPAPKPSESQSAHRPSLAYRERPTIASTVAAAAASPALDDQGTAQEETAESFAFALVNGSLGVFELRGRRVRDFKPKWPATSFVSSDVLVTAMAYRMPHVVMGDRVGNLRWWDVSTGSSSWFNSHRGGIRRIKFAPVSVYDATRGRVAVLFNDNTFAVYDLDTQDPLANAIVHPQAAGILVLELDWFPLRVGRHDPLLLCLVGADGSFRTVEIQIKVRGVKSTAGSWERVRPMPVYSPALLPSPQALALRMLLQVGVHPSWFVTSDRSKALINNSGDLRHYLLRTTLPSIGDPVALEVLLKALEPYRQAGRLLDAQSLRTYTVLSTESCAARLAYAAAYFGNYAEAIFWLQLPRALTLPSGAAAASVLSSEKRLNSQRDAEEINEQPALTQNSSTAAVGLRTLFPSDRGTLRSISEERRSWHKKLGGDEAAQKLVHEHIAAGEFEAAVTLLLATPPESPHFYVDALRAVSLAAAVSPALHDLAIKVIAANMVATEDSLCGTHLLCAVGRYQEACTQLQDAGRWEDACTLAASKLNGAELSRVLERWAEHVLQAEPNIWKALTLFVAAGALSEALLALNAQYPDVAALFLLVCHEAKTGGVSEGERLDLPGDLVSHLQDVNAVCEFYAHHQRRLSELCSELSFF